MNKKLIQLTKLQLFIVLMVLFIDCVIVVLHLSLGQQYNLFNIDLERNLPVWYQVFKVICVSGILFSAYVLWKQTHPQEFTQKKYLLTLWLATTYLAVDELGEIHEQIGDALKHSDGWLAKYGQWFTSLGFSSALWLIIFTPILLIGLIYFIFIIRWIYHQHKLLALWLLLPALFYGLVFIVEFWNTAEFSYQYTFTQRNLLVTLEEFLELLGASFLLIFALKLLNFTKKL